MGDANELSYEQLKPFKCQKCSNSFVTKHSLKLHTNVIHSNGIFECRKCDFRCDKMGVMTFHTQRHIHKERHSEPPDESYSKTIDGCETQAKVPSLILKLGKNKLNISQNRVLESQNGNENIPNNDLDSNFIDEKHPTINKTVKKSNSMFVCKICKKIFTRRVCFQKHMMIKHTELKSINVGSKLDGEHIRCLVCHKLFASKGTLKRHMLIHTGEMPFECTKCDSKFNQNIQLQQHMMKYHGEGMFKCNKCDESFIQSIHLQRHMAAHTGKKPFSCTKCDASFAMHRDLKRHLILGHDQNKAFQCRKRGNKLLLKRFVSKSMKKKNTTININITVNNSEKYLKCMKCKETVKYSQLRSHMDNHQNAFRCGNCNRIFLTQHSLKIHRAKSHKENSVNTELDLEQNYENSMIEENTGNQSHIDKDLNDFRCEICNRNCHSLRSLNIHKSKAHKDYIDKTDLHFEEEFEDTLNEKPEGNKSHNAVDQNNFRCEICEKICHSLHGLKIHKARAHKKYSNNKKINMLSEKKSDIDKEYKDHTDLMIASQMENSDIDDMKIDDKKWQVKSCEEGGKLKIKLQTNSREG